MSTVATRARMGRSLGFRPGDLSGLAMWLDAAQIPGLANADPVTTWADASGNGRDATQATAGAKPSYRTAVLNGKPVVRFDSTTDYLTCDGIAATFSGTDVACSVFAVTKLAATAVAHYPILTVYNSGDPFPFWTFRNNWPTYHVEKHDNANANVQVAAGTPDTNAHVLSYVIPGTTAGIWLDGTEIAAAGTGFDLGAATVNAATVGLDLR